MNIRQSFQSATPQDKQSPRLKEPKVVVIREEFITLTGNPLIAAVLNQLVYWSQRVTNFELFLREEKASTPKGRSSFQHGWFYKTTSELIEETMLCVTPVTLRRYLTFIEERGWIKTRINPQNKWDRTTQYRVNLRKLCRDLEGKGYALPGLLKNEFSSKLQNGSFEEKKTKKHKYSREVENDLSKLNKCSYEEEEKDHSNDEKLTSQMENNLTSNTEITTENTSKDHTQRTCARENSKNSKLKNSSLDEIASQEPVLDESVPDESVAGEMVHLWEYHVVQKLFPTNWRASIHLTQERKDQLESLFAFHFQNDIRLWERFCLRVKAAPFLMGESPSGWHVTLDWILCDRNLLKVLEGNYDDSTKTEQSAVVQGSSQWDLAKMQPNPVRDAERTAILSSIKDPIWREWCSQLAEGVRLNEMKMLHEPLSVFVLNQIANARFLECEDERLVWVGSEESHVLSRIETLRLQLLLIVQKMFPHARTVRTRLLKEKFSPEADTIHFQSLSTNPTQQQGDHHHV